MYGTQFEVIEEWTGREGSIFLKLADGSGWLFSHTRFQEQNWCDGEPANEAAEYGNSWQRSYEEERGRQENWSACILPRCMEPKP